MTIDAEVLAHAVDVHVDPAIVLHAANVHRQAGVALVDGGVDARGFLQHVGGMPWRTPVDLLTIYHRHRARLQVGLLAFAEPLTLHGGGLQLQRLLVGAGTTGQGDLLRVVEAVVHRRRAEQTAKALVEGVAAFQRGAGKTL